MNKETKRREPVLGETLFQLNFWRVSRREEPEMKPVIVTKIGRKYFTVQPAGEEWLRREFFLDTWREKTNHSGHVFLYESKQQWADEKESEALTLKFERLFSSRPNLNLDQLKRIGAIIDEPKAT